MAHPAIVIGGNYSFPGTHGKRLLTGTVSRIDGDCCRVCANDGKYHTFLTVTARKVRVRKIRRTRRAIERGEY